MKSPESECGFGQQDLSSRCYVEFSIKVREDGLPFFRVCKLSDSVDVIRYLQLLSFSNLSQLLVAAPISFPLFTVRKSWRMLISPSSTHHSTHSQCIYTPSTKQPSWRCPSHVCHSRHLVLDVLASGTLVMAHSFLKQEYFNSHRPWSLNSLQNPVLRSPSIYTLAWSPPL